MPAWEFRCPVCGRVRTHYFRSYEAMQAALICCEDGDCGVEMERLPSAPNVTFVGLGFHVNDYPKTAK